MLDVASVLKSLNAIESVLFNILSGVLATAKRERSEKKGKFLYSIFKAKFHFRGLRMFIRDEDF